MVSIVIIAHSHALATGVRDMALQMCRERPVVITAAGGVDDHALGTSYEKIEEAVNQADTEDGVLILMDMGSAVMTTQMVVEALPLEKQTHIRLSNAPLVEGAIAAAVHAAAGQNLDEVQRAAETVLQAAPKIVDPEQPGGRIETDFHGGRPAPEPAVFIEAIVPNPAGLHARPAMHLVKTALRFQSHITLQNLTQQREPVNAKMPMQVAFGATARQGDRLRIQAAGPDGDEALEVLRALVEEGFGETEPPPPPAARLLQQAVDQTPLEPSPRRLQGIAASEGIAVAPAHVYGHGTGSAPRPSHAPVRETPVAFEIDRLRRALHQAAAELTEIQARVEKDLDRASGWIFEFQRMILEDRTFVQGMEHAIQNQRRTAEAAVGMAFAALKEHAAGLDPTTQARAVDLQDVERRLGRLLGGRQEPDGLPDQPRIVVAAQLTPSDVVHLNRSQVRGIATAFGGAADHTAILARTWGIPAVAGLGESILSVTENTCLAMDGGTGRVDIDPSLETRLDYRKQADRLARFQAEVLTRALEPALTRDGKPVSVWANVSRAGEVKEALAQGAEGIGLLRTEFLYLDRATLPEEEEQFRVYRDIVAQMGPKPVVMRTLDVGGDKPLPGLPLRPERNPFLGVRAIRLCLKRPDVFQPQLRAMLRASAFGNVKILFPMITTLEELLAAKAALASAAGSLAHDGVAHNPNVPIGIMIETPAAAVKADILAPHVDFLSIGSNDLTQYTLACDRENRAVNELFDPWDPSVLRLIRDVVHQARAAHVPVGMCGEFAGQERAVPFLLGLGLNVFSVPPLRLPAVKHWIRGRDASVCQTEVENLFALKGNRTRHG